MSEHYQVIAVKAELPRVRAALDGFAAAVGGHCRTIPSADYDRTWDPFTFFIYTHEDWVVLEAELGLMPALAVYLSQDTQGYVVCRDHYSTVGYEHFSLLHAGEPIYLFTCMNDVADVHGIDPDEFAARVRPDQYLIAPGDDPAGRDFLHYAPGIFCHFIAPFNLDDFFWESVGSGQSPVECVCLDLPCGGCLRYRLGADGSADGITWDTVLQRTRRTLFHEQSIPADHSHGHRLKPQKTRNQSAEQIAAQGRRSTHHDNLKRTDHQIEVG